MSNNQVNIAQAKRALISVLQHNPSKFKPLLQGAPGTAKTALVRQVAQQLGYTHTVEVILSQKAPEHITGYPYVENGIMRYARPEWWPTEPKTVLFVDEIGQCPVAVQNVAMQLIHERRVGPHVLPEDCIVIAAGNRAEDRAGSTVLQTALRSRFFPVFEVEPTADEWCEHAKLADFHPLVIAYVQAIAKKVVDFNPKDRGGFLTLRTLEQASDLLTAFGEDPDHPDLSAALHGTIGDDHASAMLAFIKTVANLPAYDDVRSDPATAKVAEDMVEAVARMLAKHARFSHGSQLVAYIKRYQLESQSRLIRDLPDAVQRHPDVQDLRKALMLD